MYDWKRMNELVTASKDPQQFHNADGQEVFIVAYERMTGPSDDNVPRRIVGTGSTRLSAIRSAHLAMSRWDDTYRVVS